MLDKDTEEFYNEIKQKDMSNIEFVDYEDGLNYLNDLIKKKGISKAKLLSGINHDTNNGYKYLDGQRTMQRDFIIKCGIFLKLEYKTLNRLLLSFELSPLFIKRKRDAIIYQGIIEKNTLEQINQELEKECDLLF